MQQYRQIRLRYHRKWRGVCGSPRRGWMTRQTLRPQRVDLVPPVLRKRRRLQTEAADSPVVKAELTAAGLDNTRSSHARPLPYLQAHWVPAKNADLNGPSQIQGRPLRGRARRDAALLRWGFTAKPF